LAHQGQSLMKNPFARRDCGIRHACYKSTTGRSLSSARSASPPVPFEACRPRSPMLRYGLSKR
jgi:hypothetical protein